MSPKDGSFAKPASCICVMEIEHLHFLNYFMKEELSLA